MDSTVNEYFLNNISAQTLTILRRKVHYHWKNWNEHFGQ